MPGTALGGVRAPSGSQTFSYTGSEQSFDVPARVTQLTVVALGASGVGADSGSKGGRVYAVIPVTPGERLAVFVGGEGSGTSGGFNGGGNGGDGGSYYSNAYGGGGASDVRRGRRKLLIVFSSSAAEVAKAAPSGLASIPAPVAKVVAASAARAALGKTTAAVAAALAARNTAAESAVKAEE